MSLKHDSIIPMHVNASGQAGADLDKALKADNLPKKVAGTTCDAPDRFGVQVDAFKRTDADFYGAVHREEDPERDAGTTALAALVTGDSLLVANAGDCRAVICRRGRAVDLSRDHNAEYEAARVEAAGVLTILECTSYRRASMSKGSAHELSLLN